MSDSVIHLAGSPRSVFAAWQSLQRSTRSTRAGGKRRKRRGHDVGAPGGQAAD